MARGNSRAQSEARIGEPTEPKALAAKRLNDIFADPRITKASKIPGLDTPIGGPIDPAQLNEAIEEMSKNLAQGVSDAKEFREKLKEAYPDKTKAELDQMAHAVSRSLIANRYWSAMNRTEEQFGRNDKTDIGNTDAKLLNTKQNPWLGIAKEKIKLADALAEVAVGNRTLADLMPVLRRFALNAEVANYSPDKSFYQTGEEIKNYGSVRRGSLQFLSDAVRKLGRSPFSTDKNPMVEMLRKPNANATRTTLETWVNNYNKLVERDKGWEESKRKSAREEEPKRAARRKEKYDESKKSDYQIMWEAYERAGRPQGFFE